MALETQKLKSGDFLIKEGEQSTQLYAVLSGSLEVVKGEGEDEETIIGTISPGELVGEMSFLDKEPRCASVRAAEDSEVTVVPRERFEEVFDAQPEWYQKITHTLLKRLREASDQLWI